MCNNMDIFEFKKSLPDRLQELMLVLSWNNKLVPASQVRDEWSYFLQLQIEPGGWQAIWKIPRAICEDLNIPYPTLVMGVVEHVIFEELKAIFRIQAVEEENIHLPETQEVKLEDLYVTILQENAALNTEKTAEIIDNLRFFYKNIWMPWDFDDDDDLDWVKKHLESRLQFYYDLQKKVIKCSLANHIKTLLCEAKYIQDKRQFLEMNLSDNEELEEDKSNSSITDLLQLHLRLKLIKNEMEILENPHMRKVYEEIELKKLGKNKNMIENSSYTLMVVKPCFLENLKFILEISKNLISNSRLVRMCSTLQEALQISQANDQILLDSGSHEMKCVTILPDKVMLSGIIDAKKAVINCFENERILFHIDGDFTLKNLTLHCGNVRNAIIIRNGKVNITDCHIIGDENSTTKQCIYVSGNSFLIIKGCCIENFAVGLKLTENASAILENTVINNCSRAMEIGPKNNIKCENLKISNSKVAAITNVTEDLHLKDKRKVFQEFCPSANTNIQWDSDCTFENNSSNIIICNGDSKISKQFVEDISSNETFTSNMDVV